jgi:hypothetical protein
MPTITISREIHCDGEHCGSCMMRDPLTKYCYAFGKYPEGRPNEFGLYARLPECVDAANNQQDGGNDE